MIKLEALGKYLFIIPIALFGMGHLTNAPQLRYMVPYFYPGDIFWVYLTGVSMILATTAVFINLKVKLALSLLTIMLLIFALTIHLPNLINGEGQESLPMFLKDLSLAGAAFFIAHSYKKQSASASNND